MIRAPYFHRFRNDEHIQFNKDILYICTQAGEDALNIKTQIDNLRAGNSKLEAAYLVFKGSLLTAAIENEDSIRDGLIIGIEKICEAYVSYQETNYTEAAQYLLKHIRKYGESIAKINYRGETAAINDLVDTGKKDQKFSDAVALLGLSTWFTKLEASNIEFNRIFMLRIEEEAGKEKPDMRALRKESIVHFRELVKYLESYAIINPTDLYKGTVSKFNELINKYNSQKHTGKKNSEDAPVDDTKEI